jgi:hypothetical protein
VFVLTWSQGTGWADTRSLLFDIELVNGGRFSQNHNLIELVGLKCRLFLGKRPLREEFFPLTLVAGITIDTKPLKLNARSGMTLSLTVRVNREFDSNVIDESDLQNEKHPDPRISTFLGIKID